MDKKKLLETLVNRRTRLYCVLDGAAVPDLPKRLYDHSVPNFCLIRGELPDDVIYAAPYVAGLMPDSEFTNWLLDECLGKNWGIFVHCRHSLTEMRRHFRALFSVHDEQGNPLIFRFFDPRVIRTFLPTCESGELEIFFGKVEAYFVEAEGREALIRYTVEDGALKQTEIDLESEKN